MKSIWALLDIKGMLVIGSALACMGYAVLCMNTSLKHASQRTYLQLVEHSCCSLQLHRVRRQQVVHSLGPQAAGVAAQT